MEAITTALRQIFADQKATMREVVGGLDAEALNWAPDGGAETNSIAQMLSHALEAERFLVASAVGADVERHREAQVREAQFAVAIGGGEELLAEIDRTEGLVNGWLAHLSDERLAADLPRRGVPHNGAWWVLHALEHSREHVGQALLTRQLYETRQR